MSSGEVVIACCPTEESCGEASSSKKKGQTLTSTLTARSKAVCGLSNKPKVQIVDIDAADATNELAAVEYVEDMYKFYKEAESESHVYDYMDSQPEINQKMRAILVDWLIEVHNKFELSPETLYLTFNLVDRYLASKIVQVLVMEKKVLAGLEWSLTVPTPYVFLVRFIKASLPNEPDVNNMTFFLAELGMMNYATVMYCPSMVAASAVYGAHCTLNKTPLWRYHLTMKGRMWEWCCRKKSRTKSVLYRDFLLLDPCDTAAVDEYLKGEVDVRKGKHGWRQRQFSAI
ncbi:hypothetical protein POM88_025106 [Heracleum sosnowskyi]|uniref:B-like cyclin n=1 Tax=Heracleum sosnowskyi TaxID=360622 RepID=A0AAD8MMM5_9APIA|nr:hypothetical protein POM88_025106 [Heracleum sosnowskyi]